MKYRQITIIILLFSFLKGFSQNNFNLTKIDSRRSVKIDGLLNEDIWKDALFTDKLFDKNDSAKTSNQTKVYLTYDATNFYVGFDCKTKDKPLLSKKKLDKDDQNILANDWVAFSVDTYNDGVNAYTFFVDIYGNQFDGTLNSAKDLSNSFSTKWLSAINYNDDGFTIEMKIPLNNLPIKEKNGIAKIGILFVRNDKQNHTEFQFPFLKETIPNKIDNFQKIELQNVKETHPKNLSGVDIWQRLKYKKNKIDMNTLEGRSKGGDASVMDYYIFKKREIKGSRNPKILRYDLQNNLKICKAFMNTDFMKTYYPNSENLEIFLERSQTSAFLVMHNDTILYENYFNGFSKKSIFTSFSMAKSFVSILIGLAIRDGYIKSENDKITDYIPELAKKDIRFSNISIRDLLSMSSGIAYSEDGFPSDADYTYQSPDLRKMTIEKVKIDEEPQKHWDYNNYNPLLMGIILERVTQKNISDYLQEKLWEKIGGSDASWSLDENGFEKMESGFNCLAIDYAKFALLMLNDGNLDKNQIVPKKWVQNSTQPENKPIGYYDYLLTHNIYYQYFWWGKKREENQNDFFAMGNKGEYIYISPSKKLVIIRLGFEYGMFTPSPNSWPELFYQFTTNYPFKSK